MQSFRIMDLCLQPIETAPKGFQPEIYAYKYIYIYMNLNL